MKKQTQSTTERQRLDRRSGGAQRSGPAGRAMARRALAPELRRYIVRSRRFGLFSGGKENP